MDFNQLFASFNTEESYAVLFIMIVSFLFGLLTGLLLRGAKVRRLRRALKDSESQITVLKAERQGFEEKAAAEEQARIKAEEQQRVLVDKLERAGRENLRLSTELQAAAKAAEQQRAILQVHLDEIEALTQQKLTLASKNEQLEHVMETEDRDINQLAEMQSQFNAALRRLEGFEQRLTDLTGENEHLKAEVATLKVAQAAMPMSTPEPRQDASSRGGMVLAAPSVADEPAEPDPAQWLDAGKRVVSMRVAAHDYTKDDLSRIEGIGPFLETKLHEIGVHTYEDIAAFDQDRVEEVTRLIAYLPGRIEKDDWVGQARRLAEAKQSGADLATTATKHDPADLKVVEGIGPKIEQLCKDAGIQTWEDLADTPVERLRDILTAAGDKYRMHDPATWPNQARLAANGEWELLEQYQIELKGGRVVK